MRKAILFVIMLLVYAVACAPASDEEFAAQVPVEEFPEWEQCELELFVLEDYERYIFDSFLTATYPKQGNVSPVHPQSGCICANIAFMPMPGDRLQKESVIDALALQLNDDLLSVETATSQVYTSTATSPSWPTDSYSISPDSFGICWSYGQPLDVGEHSARLQFNRPGHGLRFYEWQFELTD